MFCSFFYVKTFKKAIIGAWHHFSVRGFCAEGKYDLVWSYMSDFENNHNPNIENKKSIQLWESIAKLKCKSSKNIAILGNKIEKKGIRSKDALHIACAVESKCEYFITTDTGLLNKSIGWIKTLNPIDFVRKMEEDNEN